jgi:hypothetical protein
LVLVPGSTQASVRSVGKKPALVGYEVVCGFRCGLPDGKNVGGVSGGCQLGTKEEDFNDNQDRGR